VFECRTIDSIELIALEPTPTRSRAKCALATSRQAGGRLSLIADAIASLQLRVQLPFNLAHDAGESRQGAAGMKRASGDAISSTRFLARAALIVLMGIAVPASAQQSAIPNFTSANFGWLVSSGFDFLPIEGQRAPVGGPDPQWRGGIGLPANDFNYQPPEAATDPRRRGPARIGPWNIERLSDVDNPNLKPWSAAEMRMHNELVANGRRAFSAMSRCWPGGPAQDLFNAEPIYFVQTATEVWILWQRDHLARRVFLNRGHSQNVKLSWFGESVGHYEGGELVIDTIGFVEHPYSFVDNWRTPHTKDLHMVERWKIADGGNAIEARVTFDDQGAFNAPWSGLVRWSKSNGPMLESVCPENNENYGKFLGLSEYPMPEAKTPDF